MGLSRGSLTNQGTDSLIFEKQLTHKVSDTHEASSSFGVHETFAAHLKSIKQYELTA